MCPPPVLAPPIPQWGPSAAVLGGHIRRHPLRVSVISPRKSIVGLAHGMSIVGDARAWHSSWPAHVARSIEYPAEPAWALLERNLPQSAQRIAIREVDHKTRREGRVLTYEQLFSAARGVATGLRRLG